MLLIRLLNRFFKSTVFDPASPTTDIAFSRLLQILNLSVFTQSDGNYAASVKVPSQQDAQFVISKLHHKIKIGYKRIAISYAHSGVPHNIALIRYGFLTSVSFQAPG